MSDPVLVSEDAFARMAAATLYNEQYGTELRDLLKHTSGPSFRPPGFQPPFLGMLYQAVSSGEEALAAILTKIDKSVHLTYCVYLFAQIIEQDVRVRLKDGANNLWTTQSVSINELSELKLSTAITDTNLVTKTQLRVTGGNKLERAAFVNNSDMTTANQAASIVNGRVVYLNTYSWLISLYGRTWPLLADPKLVFLSADNLEMPQVIAQRIGHIYSGTDIRVSEGLYLPSPSPLRAGVRVRCHFYPDQGYVIDSALQRDFDVVLPPEPQN